MVFIADETGEPIWDQNLDPILDGWVSGTFVEGGLVVTAPYRSSVVFAPPRVEVVYV